jgi:hypothetical protein
MRVKTICGVGLLVLCGVVVAGSALAAGDVAALSPREIADKPEMVIEAIRDRNAEDSAAIVVKSLAEILASDWSEAKRRESVISLITYAVAAKGMDSAPMMGILAARVPSAWLTVIAATAVLAAGDNSPSVAKAMLTALDGDTARAESCRTACANPSTVLLPTEIGTVRGIILPTPSAAPAKAPPLPTIIRPAEQYSGQ